VPSFQDSDLTFRHGSQDRQVAPTAPPTALLVLGEMEQHPEQTRPRRGADPLPGVAFDVAVAGSYASVAALISGLRIIDISNPAAPFEADYHGRP
jgi:hypothetical protein